MNLADWRPRNGGLTHVLKLKLGDKVWNAVAYHQYGHDTIDVIGELPENWTKENRFQFLIEGRLWCIVSFLNNYESIPKEAQRFHSFGNHWTLIRWSGEVRPYPIVEITVE